MQALMIRLLSVVGLFILGLIFPWWVVIIGVVIMSFIFNHFYEAVIIGVIYDIFFRNIGTEWYFSFSHTLILLIVVIIMSNVQKVMRRPKLFS